MNELYFLTGSFIQAAIPVAVVVAGCWVASRTALGRALVERLRAGRADPEEAAQLKRQVEALRVDVEDLHERLDFTERMSLVHRDKRVSPTQRTPTPV